MEIDMRKIPEVETKIQPRLLANQATFRASLDKTTPGWAGLRLTLQREVGTSVPPIARKAIRL
jgi:hypothetical protein